MSRAPEFPKGTVPAGATHFYHNPEHPKPSTFAWRKQVGSKWFMFKADEWIPINGNSVHLFVPIGDVLRPEPAAVGWDGAGMPPVGANVQSYDYGGVTVLAHGVFRGQPVVIAQGDDTIVTATADQFFPFRTAEQIVAGERYAAISQMANAAGYVNGAVEDLPPVFAAIYDAGYRRTEVQS